MTGQDLHVNFFLSGDASISIKYNDSQNDIWLDR